MISEEVNGWEGQGTEWEEIGMDWFIALDIIGRDWQ
jgi:hypothetical protein